MSDILVTITDQSINAEVTLPGPAGPAGPAGEITDPLPITTIKTDTDAPTDLHIITGEKKTLILDTPVYEDIIIQATNLRVGSTPPAFVAFIGNIYALSFINGSTDIVYGSAEMPHGYKEGTDIEAHLHWSPSSTNTGNCVWLMQYCITGAGGVFSSVNDVNFSQAGGGSTTSSQYVTGDVAISGTGITIGSVIVFALSRPTGDAFTGDAFLHSIGLHYQKDTIGSREMRVK